MVNDALNPEFDYLEAGIGDGNDLEQKCITEQENKVPVNNFMKHHFQRYPYYPGRTPSFRDNFHSLQEWKRNYDVRLSGRHDLSVVEEQFQGKILDNPLFSGDNQLPDDLLHRTTQLVFQYQAGRKIPKLREPRNLYALTKEAGPQQATRWPSHMQVVCPAIRFIDYTTPEPVPLYKPTGKEITPGVRGAQQGELIYYNDPGRDLYFMRSRVAGCRLAMRSTTLSPRDYPEDNLTLEFEARFESGNLLKVDKINDFEYELTLRTDLYTTKHTQWFFFRVRNMRPCKNYRFTIVNLMKPSSLYNQGMRPVWYSDLNAKKNKIGWSRTGTNIRYYRNNLCSNSGRTYYSLTWTCDFPYKDDTCYFAHCFPYTYTDLQEYLLELANDPVRSRFCKQRVLCRTLAGNLVYILTITSPSRNPEISRAKKAVILTARVHPGETNSSWMMKGFLDYLSGSSADAKLLRDTFIFKIVPMLNPDGVIVGNYRCSLAGRDLNRNYKSVLKDSFPSIWHTRVMAKRLVAEREVVLYCDLHGHSRKNNIFIYGCENKRNPQKRLRERVFPLMLSKNAMELFSFDSCKYKVQRSKEGTGRIVMWYLGIMNSYTMEATFGGSSMAGDRKNTHLSTRDLERMGFYFCDTLLDYCDPDPSKVVACMRELQDRLKKQILKKLQLQNPNVTDINLDEYMSDIESDTSGSDSSCDDGLPVHLLAIAPKLQRKKKMRSRKERNKVTPVKSNVTVPSENNKQPSQSAKLAHDKSKPLRYTQTASGRKRDERSTIPHPSGFADDRGTEKTQKKSDYLEALTSAYMRSGVLMAPDPKKDYPLRYTKNGMNNSRDGNFNVHYLANRIGRLSGSDSEKLDMPQMVNASCQWSPQPDSLPESESEVDADEVNKEAILAEEQYELLRQSALRRQLSAGQQRLLAQKHLVAVAAMQQRRDDISQKQRITSNTDDRIVPVQFRDNPLQVEGERPDSESPFMTSHIIRPTSRCVSTSDLPPDLPRVIEPGGSVSATFGGKNLFDGDFRAPQNNSEGVAATYRSPRPFSGNNKKGQSKQSTVPSSTETLIKINKTHHPKPESTKPTTLSSVNKEHYFTTKNYEESKDFLSHHDKKQIKKDNALDMYPDVKPHRELQRLPWENQKNEMQHSDKLALKTNAANDANIVTSFPLPKTVSPKTTKHGIVDLKSNKIITGGKLNEANAGQMSGEEGLSPKHKIVTTPPREHPDSTFSLPPRLRTINQAMLKGLVKGEVALPPGTEVPIIPPGIKKTTSFVMESDPDSLSVQSNRYYTKPSTPDKITNGHSNRMKAKNYETTEESFFGMSDRVGVPMNPRNGRVPPVVANIAELRRSLMGQGREANEQPRKIVTQHSDDNMHRLDDGIPFSQRPKRKNGFFKQQNQKPVSNHLPPKVSGRTKKPTEAFSVPSIEDSPLITKKPIGSRIVNSRENIDELLSDENDDWDNMSTIATLNETTGERKPTKRHSRPQLVTQGDMFLPSEDETDPFIVTAKTKSGRSYTQGNTTIEKPSDQYCTNIRIGSRTSENTSRISEHWIEMHQQRENTGGIPSRPDKQTISAVSFNMVTNSKDDRTCVNTPALASRPVPTMLRYLSAKQGQNKRK